MTRLMPALAALVAAAAVTSVAIPLTHPIRGAGGAAAFRGERPQQSQSEPDKAMLRRQHDLDLLQGTWHRISSEVDGQKMPPEPKVTIVFKGDGWYGAGRDGKTLVKHHVIKLDTTRRPKAIDLYYLDRKGSRSDHAPILGIYEFNPEGDILTLCLNIGGRPEDRPKGFAARAGRGATCLDVYRRKKMPEGRVSQRSG